MPSGERILIIDDEKLCRLIREYLGAMGYEVESAAQNWSLNPRDNNEQTIKIGDNCLDFLDLRDQWFMVDFILETDWGKGHVYCMK